MTSHDFKDGKISGCRILVTATTFGMRDPSLRKALEDAVEEVRYNPLGRPLKASELQGMVRDIDGIIAGVDEISAEVLEAAPRLKVISRYGVGVDGIDIEAATKKGIVVTNTPGANSSAVAELTIGLVIALARRICEASSSTRNGLWPRMVGIGLKGKTVGLVGLGRIGKEVARRLRAFECRVLAFDPAVSEEEAREVAATKTELSELLSESDIVSLHVPLLPSTRDMVNEEFIRLMKKDAFLVNTARGELVDEEALHRALREGRLAGAALDCMRQEPPPKAHPLLEMKEVLLTPHMGAHTDEAMSVMGWMALRACLAVLKGQRPENVVNEEVYQCREGL